MQTLHGIDISMSYGLNYLRLCYFLFQRETSLFLECGWQTHTLFYREVSLCLGLKPFLFHQLSWWFFFTQVTKKKKAPLMSCHQRCFPLSKCIRTAKFVCVLFGWDSWIRTSGMTESKSVALPLGYIPSSCPSLKQLNHYSTAF